MTSYICSPIFPYLYCSMQMRKTYTQMKTTISTNDLTLDLTNVSRETLEKKYIKLLEIQRSINTMVQQVEAEIFLPF